MKSQATAPVAPTTEENFLTIRHPKDELRIGLLKHCGLDLASIRAFFRDSEGEWRPHGRRGIAVAAAEAEAIGKALVAIGEAYRKRQGGASAPTRTPPGDEA